MKENIDFQHNSDLTETDLLKLLVEQAKDTTIILLDKEGKVISWNPAAESMMGWKAEEIIGHSFKKSYPVEDIENESRRFINNMFQTDPVEFPDRQLQAVRTALQQFLPEYHDLMIKRQPLRMVVTKGNQELRIDSLSSGETCFIALIGDIARRLAIANPQSPNPLEGEGIILIDEIDLHLHPAWQRRAITKLTEVFPNVQFVVTTHSPQILSEVPANSIRLLYQENNVIKYTIPRQSIGLNSAEILQMLMDDPGINSSVPYRIEEIAAKIDHDEFDAARELIKKLKEDLNGSIPDIVEAEATIAMLEPEDGAGA